MPIPIFGPNEITEDPYEVVINHTDPGEIKTALALAEKKLARAEKRMKLMYETLKEAKDVLIALGIDSGNYNQMFSVRKIGQEVAAKCENAMKPTADRQLEDVLMPDKGGGLPECQWRRPCGTCYNLGSINSGGACSPHCSAPNKGGE